MKIRTDTAGDRLLSTRELCLMLGQSRMTLWRVRRDGILPAPVQLGRRIAWRASDIKRWLEERRV